MISKEDKRLVEDLGKVCLHGTPPMETIMKLQAIASEAIEENERLEDGVRFIHEQFSEGHGARDYACWILKGANPRDVLTGAARVPKACLKS
jgi:hypothetical protein